MLKVMKFGGISIKDAESFRRSCNVVASAKGTKVVVVSAAYGVTDTLHNAIDEARRDEATIAPFIKELKATHEKIATEALMDEALLKSTLSRLNTKIKKLERVLYGVAYTEEITTRTHDLAVSFGERLSVEIMANVLNSMDIKAKALDSDQIGMITNGVFGNATALIPIIEKNFQETLVPIMNDGTIPIITGYFGCDIDGKTTTFARGGSDYGAAVVANALNANVLEVWKDVDGFMTANPKVISTAKKLEQMSYDEAAELAYFGAKVLHPRTIEVVSRKNIPILVKNVFKPGKKGTRISGEPIEECAPLRGITSKSDLAIIKLYGPGMAYTPGIASRIFTQLNSRDINVYGMATAQSNFALVIEQSDLENGVEVLDELRGSEVKGINPLPDMALICIVGQGMAKTQGVASRIFTAIAKAKINVEMISQGASDIAFSLVVSKQDEEETIRVIHNTFIEC